MNYHALPRTQKEALKPLVKEIRKLLYEENESIDMDVIEDEGISINFGKGDETRFTVKLQIVS